MSDEEVRTETQGGEGSRAGTPDKAKSIPTDEGDEVEEPERTGPPDKTKGEGPDRGGHPDKAKGV